MKVVLIGGSSPSTPALIEYLAAHHNLPDIEIILLGRSKIRLELVSNAARILAGNAPITITTATTTDPRWRDTFLGADVIVLQARIGGYEARLRDETFPLRYGVCGDQDLGPGGISNAWRSWPEIRQFFVEAGLRSPHARFFVLSSPVGILVRLGLLAAPRLRVMGMCELPRTTLHEICDGLKIPDSEVVSLGYIGLHHMGWLYRLNSATRDLIHEYETIRKDSNTFPSAHLIREYSAIPTRYVRLHFHRSEVIAEQKQAPGARSLYLAHYREKTFATFANGCGDAIKAVLRERPAPWYSEALGPLILAGPGCAIAQPVFLSGLAGSGVSDFPENEILELAHSASDTIDRLTVPRPIPEKVVNWIATEAIWRLDPETLRLALATHPWTSSLDNSARAALANDIMVTSAVI